jgi:hypothetical protein
LAQSVQSTLGVRQLEMFVEANESSI